MAYKILDDCINFNACTPECPNDAITEGKSIYLIDPKLCTECAGFYDEPQCATLCPVESIVKIPA